MKTSHPALHAPHKIIVRESRWWEITLTASIFEYCNHDTFCLLAPNSRLKGSKTQVTNYSMPYFWKILPQNASSIDKAKQVNIAAKQLGEIYGQKPLNLPRVACDPDVD